jgi:hypothetical protein
MVRIEGNSHNLQALSLNSLDLVLGPMLQSRQIHGAELGKRIGDSREAPPERQLAVNPELQCLEGLEQPKRSIARIINAEFGFTDLFGQPRRGLSSLALFTPDLGEQLTQRVLILTDVAAEGKEKAFSVGTLCDLDQMIDELERGHRTGQVVVQIGR